MKLGAGVVIRRTEGRESLVIGQPDETPLAGRVRDARNSRRALAFMLIVHVHVQVKPESVEAFQAASLENARHSIQEPGVARFDVVQQADDPTRFVLVEVYRTDDAPARHKETAHYARWR